MVPKAEVGRLSVSPLCASRIEGRVVLAGIPDGDAYTLSASEARRRGLKIAYGDGERAEQRHRCTRNSCLPMRTFRAGPILGVFRQTYQP